MRTRSPPGGGGGPGRPAPAPAGLAAGESARLTGARPARPLRGLPPGRFADDRHIWAPALYDEVVPLGYGRSYESFVRQVRQRGLRPRCEACAGVKGRETVEIDHPPGEEIQWDWFERRRGPWGGTAYVLLGTLPHSGRIRGVPAESLDQAHLVEAMHAVCERLGGTARRWRVDRMATVIVPGSAEVQASFAPVAKHYGVAVDPCPPRRGNRKGSVESSVRYVCGRWWRTMTASTPEEAQISLDRFCSTTADARRRAVAASVAEDALASDDDATVAGVRADGRLWRPSVAALAYAEPLAPLPAMPYPATLQHLVPVAANATVSFRGNRYSVPPGLAGVELTPRHRLGTATMEVHAPAGALLVSHRLAPRAAGLVVRTAEHRGALESVVLSAFTSDRPCERKGNHPPGEAARAEAAKLLADLGPEVVVDLNDSGERWSKGAGNEQGLHRPRCGPPGDSAPNRRRRGPPGRAGTGPVRSGFSHRFPGAAAGRRGHGHRGAPAGQPGPLRLPALALAAVRFRLRRPALSGPLLVDFG